MKKPPELSQYVINCLCVLMSLVGVSLLILSMAMEFSK